MADTVKLSRTQRELLGLIDRAGTAGYHAGPRTGTAARALERKGLAEWQPQPGCSFVGGYHLTAAGQQLLEELAHG